MTDDMMPEKKDNRPLAIGLAIAAAACLLFASFTQKWLVNTQLEVGFGLRSNQECAGPDSCRSQSNSSLVSELQEAEGNSDNASGAFAPMGWVTFGVLLAAALGLLGAAGIAAAKKKPTWPMAPTTVTLLGLMISLITGCVFVATKPGPAGFVGVGLSFWLFGAGAVIGIAAAQMLAKINRPEDPDLMAGAMNPDQF